MNHLQIDALLSQIRAVSNQVHGGVGGVAGVDANAPLSRGAASGAADKNSFAALLKNGVEQVNQTQQRADGLATAFERGTPGVELPQVMLEMQKANVSFRALTEVRNRMVNVYQEIMNMPI